MKRGQEPRPTDQGFDTLGGADPRSWEDVLAVSDITEPSVIGPDTLGGPDTGPEDVLAVSEPSEIGPDTLGGPDIGSEDVLAVPVA